MLRKRVRISDDYDGIKLRTTVDGTRMFTPILIVFIAIGTTDLLFALDSIPAIFGITQSAFIVFTANVFALMGLRQLYFLLGGLLERLEYLKYGTSPSSSAFIGREAFVVSTTPAHAYDACLCSSTAASPSSAAPEISTVGTHARRDRLLVFPHCSGSSLVYPPPRRPWPSDP
jgi:hypothetical protein